MSFLLTLGGVGGRYLGGRLHELSVTDPLARKHHMSARLVAVCSSACRCTKILYQSLLLEGKWLLNVGKTENKGEQEDLVAEVYGVHFSG